MYIHTKKKYVILRIDPSTAKVKGSRTYEPPFIASIASGKRKKKTPKNRNEWKLYVNVNRGCSMTVTNFDIVYVY